MPMKAGPFTSLPDASDCMLLHSHIQVLVGVTQKCSVKVSLNIAIGEYHNCDHFIIQQQQ